MLLLRILMLFGLLLTCTSYEKSEIVTLPEETGFIQIPGVGWQTFFRTALEEKNMNGLRFKSGCAYMRWTWGDLEPEEGKYAFAMIDDWLRRCRQGNQALAFRVMLSWPGHEGTLPEWLINKGIKLTWSACPKEGPHYQPDMEDPILKSYHEKLIRALGNRYDDHPDICLVDIGSVGLWGEWHIYCDRNLMPGDAERKSIIDLYYDAFPNTPLTALVDDRPNALYSNSKGRTAWRGDCWGDEWHRNQSYWIMHNQMPDGWKTGTVALEPCGTLGKYSISSKVSVDDAIAWHTTFAQNKSNPIPSDWIPEIERLVMKMGFRLVLRNVTYNNKTRPGLEVPLTMNWENLGIAPPYRDHRIALRLKDKNDQKLAAKITDISILGWLPGEKNVSLNYRLPDDLPPGSYTLEMGLVYHSSIIHTIPIANKGKTEDGWYPLGHISIL